MAGTHDVDGRLLRGVLYDKLGVNEGMFFENYVAQALVSRGYDLLFHSRSNPRVEVDFLFRNGIKVCPVEVKSSGYRVHASLDWLVNHHPANPCKPRYEVCRLYRRLRDGCRHHLSAILHGTLPLVPRDAAYPIAPDKRARTGTHFTLCILPCCLQTTSCLGSSCHIAVGATWGIISHSTIL